jgi:hypothetical protein
MVLLFVCYAVCAAMPFLIDCQNRHGASGDQGQVTKAIQSVRTPRGDSKKKFSEAIEDNSFFIEEAYNQEKRVVQHIFEVYYFGRPQKDLTLNFTQEWPAFGLKHQISYTILYNSLNANAVSGLNDALINYRYQLIDDENGTAVAPRLSFILPTGSTRKGLGSGVAGIQFNLPTSQRFTEFFVAHLNIGFTFLPRAKGYDLGDRIVRRDLFSYFYGASAIYLASPKYNFLVEYLFNNYSEINEQGGISHWSETILSPGFRYALDLGQLQVVPGVAMPISWSRGQTRIGIFFYLSFEHPY